MKLTSEELKQLRENPQPEDLGSVDLSDTMIDESTVTNNDVVDLSNTQALPVTIITEVQTVEKHKVPKWVAPLFVALSVVVLVTLALLFKQASSDTFEQSQADVTRTEHKDLTSQKSFTADLKKTADHTGTPYTVTTEQLGGGYTLGITTYNPNKPSELYVDYNIKAPDEKSETATDENTKEIEDTLKKDLPTINTSIHVKEKDKVSMETYKVGDNYQTILLYDGNPFGYVVTDKDGMSTNYVTSYYVTHVASE